MNRHELTIEELALELYSQREAPSQEFAAQLDARAAAGFPRRGSELIERFGSSDAAQRLVDRMRSATSRRRTPRRLLLPALAGTASVIIAATAVVVATDNGSGGPSDNNASRPQVASSEAAAKASPSGGAAAQLPDLAPAPTETLDGPVAKSVIGLEPPLPDAPAAPGVRNRQVERSAQLTLGSEPEQVRGVAAKAIEVVGRYRGFVLSSSVRDGAAGDAGASFELLIPSTRLSGALADLSAIADVRSRSENTLDITAPYVSAREHLRDSRAEAEGLLRQLAEAVTEGERASVKAQLQIVRGRIAAFRSQVDRLERRASFSHVSLQIVTGKASAVPGAGGGDWTIDDAVHDAGRVLAVAAGVALLGAALILPLGLLGAAAWGARRIYLRRARAQTLSA